MDELNKVIEVNQLTQRLYVVQLMRSYLSELFNWSASLHSLSEISRRKRMHYKKNIQQGYLHDFTRRIQFRWC